MAIAIATIVLLVFGVAHAASSGPASGGNTLTITGTSLGNGSDITNVTLCGVPATIQSQTTNSVTVMAGAAGDGSTGDIVVYSTSVGMTTFANGYTYNPPGDISGAFTGWSSLSDLPVGLSALAAASAYGKIYAIGGFSGVPGGYTSASTVYVYDTAHPAQGWSSAANLPMASSGLAAVTVNGRIYAIGVGTNVYVYDPAQPMLGWLSVSNLPTVTHYLAAASANGKIYAIGLAPPGNLVYVYDTAQPTLGWLSVSNLPWRPSGNIAATAANGKIYVLGGQTHAFLVYDPAQPTLGWSWLTNLPTDNMGLAAASVNGKIYAIAGFDPDTVTALSSVHVYDPAQPALGWSIVNNLPVASDGLAAASVNGNIYVMGGGYNSGYLYPNVYETSFAPGVVPSLGPCAGGNIVTITGNNLGNHDVTNVTLCGTPATILSDNSPAQIMVTAGATATPTNGDVVVNSASCGVTVATGAYTYWAPLAITGSLPPGMVGTAYNQTLAANGGMTPYTLVHYFRQSASGLKSEHNRPH